jgi:hypothetical protein
MSSPLIIGSQAHKELFCRVFLATHVQYDVRTIHWPTLDRASIERLRMLPFWEEALGTEHATAAKVQAQAGVEHDALLREAVALQGYEEARHSALLRSLLTHYDIHLPPQPSAPLSENITWAFLRTEYGECFDSFFAFGLFAVAKEAGLFPRALVERFDPIMQEEARHILFFVNWLGYRRAQLQRRGLLARPVARAY